MRPSRTPLFGVLTRAFGLAGIATRPGAPPIDELCDPGFARITRRTLLGGVAAGVALAGLPALAQPRLSRTDARIAVVGGGLAGLVTAHRLIQAGARNVTIYEGNTRTGGRMLSGRDILGEGVTVELGGSFINTDHTDVRRLTEEFNLRLEDGTQGEDANLNGTFFIAGEHRTMAQIAAAGAEAVRRLEGMRQESDDAKAAHDRRSAAQLMDELRITGWLRRLLDIGLTQEMGLEPDRMSALYLIESFAPDPANLKRGLFSSDQRFQVEGGNDRLPAAIAERHRDRIRLGHKLVSARRAGTAYALTFERGAPVTADILILAMPLTTLRGVDLDLGLPPLTRRAIRTLTYGTNAKLFAGVNARPWRRQGRSGECLNDLGFQTVWEDHGKEGVGAGSFTIFAGGRVGEGFARGRAADRAREVTQRLDAAFPGAAAAFNGRASRMHWPTNPFAGGSYTCYAPGQWVGFEDAFDPVGRVFFAGEHTAEHSGYMDGAAQSGREAAEAVAQILA